EHGGSRRAARTEREKKLTPTKLGLGIVHVVPPKWRKGRGRGLSVDCFVNNCFDTVRRGF
ncbi:MAG: hypothetical protein OEW21_08375, partial [Betaproteobacteria bacterium]|nr:hypothetical protein [Betaproteobacteria bacterium]